MCTCLFSPSLAVVLHQAPAASGRRSAVNRQKHLTTKREAVPLPLLGHAGGAGLTLPIHHGELVGVGQTVSDLQMQ